MWNITLEVVDCGAMSTRLSGAKVELGTSELGFTDANGRFVANLDDTVTLAIFKISKADYVKGNFKFEQAVDAGTVKTVCLDNPATIPDGHNPDIPGESGGQEFGNGGCFIVTATTGSAASLEVRRLRQLRDRVGAVSRLGSELIEEIYREYAQFSPPIAADLQHDALTRAAVLQAVVRPLFAWYTLAGKLALEHAGPPVAAHAAHEAIGACPPALIDTVVPLLETLRAGGELPPETPATLRELGARLTRLPFASWAILDPLLRVWRAAADDRDVIEDVAQWLAAAPLEALSPVRDHDALATELDVLAGFFAFRPGWRQPLGQRLLAAWPDTSAALARAGFTGP